MKQDSRSRTTAWAMALILLAGMLSNGAVWARTISERSMITVEERIISGKLDNIIQRPPITTDDLGNVYMAGDLDSGDTNFGGGPLSTPVGSHSIFMVKYDGDGNHVWSKNFPNFDLGDPVNPSMSVTALTEHEGALYLALYVSGSSIDLGQGTLSGNLYSVLAKFDLDGNLQWNLLFDFVFPIRIRDVLGEGSQVFLTGTFRGLIDMGGGAMVSPEPDTAYDIFLTALDAADGSHNWSHIYYGTGEERPTALCSVRNPDGTGSKVILAGIFSSDLQSDMGGFVPLTTRGGKDIFLVGVSPNNKIYWNRQEGGTEDDQVFDLAGSALATFTLAGSFAGSGDFGGVNLTSAGGTDLLMVRYDLPSTTAPVTAWAQRFGDASNQSASSIEMDAAGHLVVSGRFDGSMDLDGLTITDDSFLQSMFLARFGLDGGTLAARSASSTVITAPKLAVDPAGNYWFSGEFYHSADFGVGPVSVLNLALYLVKDSALVLEPASLDFGRVMVGESAELSYTIHNFGAEPFVSPSIFSCPEYTVSVFSFMTPGVDESQPVTVTYTPPSATTHDCVINNGTPYFGSVSCTGFGGNPTQLSFDGTPFDFSVNLDGVQYATPVTVPVLENSGYHTAVASGGIVYPIGYATSHWTTDAWAFNTPSPRVIELLVETRSISSTAHYMSFSTTPEDYVYGSTMDFGTVAVGETSTRSFTLHNPGQIPLTGDFIVDCTHYTVIGGGGPFNLSPGESLQIEIQFVPLESGFHACYLESGFWQRWRLEGTAGCGVPILYVDDSASGAGTGLNWTDAYTDLNAAVQGALDVMGGGPGPGGDDCPGPIEIWVAEGSYVPTTDTNPSISFNLANSVEIYGGFTGTETARDQRDWLAHPTVLSGEIDTPDISDNSYHVVYASNVDLSAVLDGFIITRGNAYGSGSNRDGGGMRCENADPTLTRLLFVDNHARTNGAGMYVASAPTGFRLENIGFFGNLAEGGGGGLYLDVDADLMGLVFSGNSARRGGGLYLNATINTPLTNLSFASNSAEEGGALYCDECESQITNSVFWDNQASILGPQIHLKLNNAAGPTLAYSDLQGSGGSGVGWDPSMGIDGGANLEQDPLFTSALGLDATPGTLDDDLSLSSGSQVIDKGTESVGPFPTEDLAGKVRVTGISIDMGAYEFAPDVVGVPDTPAIVQRIILHDAVPNPFNPQTALRFGLPRATTVRLGVYDIAGHLVQTLIDGEAMSAGIHDVVWRGRDHSGRAVASGVYLYRLDTENSFQTKRMILLK